MMTLSLKVTFGILAGGCEVRGGSDVVGGAVSDEVAGDGSTSGKMKRGGVGSVVVDGVCGGDGGGDAGHCWVGDDGGVARVGEVIIRGIMGVVEGGVVREVVEVIEAAVGDVVFEVVVEVGVKVVEVGVKVVVEVVVGDVGVEVVVGVVVGEVVVGAV